MLAKKAKQKKKQKTEKNGGEKPKQKAGQDKASWRG